MNNQDKQELESIVFKKLLSHLDSHKEVQNIDLMILAKFCRNCLSKWYSEAAQEKDLDIDLDAAKQIIYGMPYSEWKEKYQPRATEEQLRLYSALQSSDD